MKIIYIALATLLTLCVVVSFTVSSHRSTVEQIAPKLDSDFNLGLPRPAKVYCEHVLAERPGYQYCSYGQDVYIIVERGVITRVYMFLRPQTITIGQLINELGAPQDASYMREGMIVMRWPHYLAGVAVNDDFSPASKVFFVGWGKPYDAIHFVTWRGFSRRP